jgi:hypothetical protein
MVTDSDPELDEIYASIPISNLSKVLAGSVVRTGVRIPMVFDRTIRSSSAIGNNKSQILLNFAMSFLW